MTDIQVKNLVIEPVSLACNARAEGWGPLEQQVVHADGQLVVFGDCENPGNMVIPEGEKFSMAFDLEYRLSGQSVKHMAKGTLAGVVVQDNIHLRYPYVE